MSQAITLRHPLSRLARITPDRRRHPRFSATLLGRFMRANKQEYPCKLVDISVSGAAIMSPVEVDMGERIVAYFDMLGGLEGQVVRHLDGGFAMVLHASAHKREKLASQIIYLVNRHELEGAELRREGHDRLTVTAKDTTLRLDDGREIACVINDVSISGASVVTDVPLPVGTTLVFGKLRARVARQHDNGLGLEFLDIQQPEAIRRYFS